MNNCLVPDDFSMTDYKMMSGWANFDLGVRASLLSK